MCRFSFRSTSFEARRDRENFIFEYFYANKRSRTSDAKEAGESRLQGCLFPPKISEFSGKNLSSEKIRTYHQGTATPLCRHKARPVYGACAVRDSVSAFFLEVLSRSRADFFGGASPVSFCVFYSY